MSPELDPRPRSWDESRFNSVCAILSLRSPLMSRDMSSDGIDDLGEFPLFASQNCANYLTRYGPNVSVDLMILAKIMPIFSGIRDGPDISLRDYRNLMVL